METIKKITTRKFAVTGSEIVGIAYDTPKTDVALQGLSRLQGVTDTEHFCGEIVTAWKDHKLRTPQKPAEVVKWAWIDRYETPLNEELKSREFSGTGKVVFHLNNGELSTIIFK